MLNEKGPYEVRRIKLTQDDIWTPNGVTPVLTIKGDAEELFVIGTVTRNNNDGSEQFTPRRIDGKIGDAYRSEGYARHICHNCNVPSWNAIWNMPSLRSQVQDDPHKRALLTEVVANYFVPDLEYARHQAQQDGYDRALANLIKAAKLAGRWHIGCTVVCITERSYVLINDLGTPFADPPLITLSIEDLAKLAFPEQSVTSAQ